MMKGNRCVIIGGAGITDYQKIKSYLKPDDYNIYCDCGLKHAPYLEAAPHLIVGDFDSLENAQTAQASAEQAAPLCEEFPSAPMKRRNTDLSPAISYMANQGKEAEAEFASAGVNGKIGKTYFRNAGKEKTPDSAAEPLHTSPKTDSGYLFRSLSAQYPDAEIRTLPQEKYDTDTVYGIKEGIARGFSKFLLIGMIGQRMDHSLVNLYTLLKLDSMGKRALLLDDYSEMEIVSGEPAFVEDRFRYFSLINIAGLANDVTIEHAKYALSHGDISSEYQYATSNEVLPGQTARITVGEGRVLLIRVW